MAFDDAVYYRVVASTIALLPCASVAFFLRCYVKLRIVHAFTVEDWLMLVSLICFVAFNILIIRLAINGFGQHVDNLDLTQVTHVARLFWISEIVYIIVNTFAKLSIAFLLLRLAVRRVQAIIIKVVAVVNTLCSVVFFFTVIFQCWPVQFFWDKSLQNGSCKSRDVVVDLAYLSAGLNAATDFIYAFLPIWMVWKIQMEIRTKISVCFVLALGIVTVMASMARIKYINELALQPDFSYTSQGITITSNLELGFGIIAASLATLRPLIRTIRSKIPACHGRNCTSPNCPVLGGANDHNHSHGRSASVSHIHIGNDTTTSSSSTTTTITTKMTPTTASKDKHTWSHTITSLLHQNHKNHHNSQKSKPTSPPSTLSTPLPFTTPCPFASQQQSQTPNPQMQPAHRPTTGTTITLPLHTSRLHPINPNRTTISLTPDAQEWEATCMAARERAKQWSEAAMQARDSFARETAGGGGGGGEGGVRQRERGDRRESYVHESLGVGLPVWPSTVEEQQGVVEGGRSMNGGKGGEN